MKKIIDSITGAAAEKAAEATKKVLNGLEPGERLLVVGLALIGLSCVATGGENKPQGKGPRRPHKTGPHS